jgi:hypothetical protein
MLTARIGGRLLLEIYEERAAHANAVQLEAQPHRDRRRGARSHTGRLTSKVTAEMDAMLRPPSKRMHKIARAHKLVVDDRIRIGEETLAAIGAWA